MRLLVVDDHEVVRRGVRSLLSGTIECEICGEAVDGQNALRKVRELNPDLVVMDVSMPGLNGIEATRQIRSSLPNCAIIILSQHETDEMARQAFRAGARGYVVKSSISKDLISAITKVSKGEYFFDSAILKDATTVSIGLQEILQRSAGFEQALRDSEELYRSSFELIAVGIAHLSADGRWLRVNRKLCDIVGFSEAELLQLTFQDITHPDDLAADLALAEKVRSRQLQTYSMEKRYIRKDGTIVWINLNVSGVWDSSGQLKHFIAVIEDISKRKRAESALRESQTQLALALECSRTAMFDWDVAQRRGRWNPHMAAIYDFNPEGEYITAEEWRSLFHPDDRARLTQEAETVWREEEQFTFEFRTFRRNGEIRWILSHGRVVRDATGTAVQMIGTHTDITDRKRVEESLAQRQSELAEAQRLAKIGTWHWTPATGTMVWSEEVFRIAGRDPASQTISYRDHHNLYTPESWERLQAAVNQALENGTPYSVELEMIRSDGEKRWVRADGEPLQDSTGKITALRGTIQDIHDRKTAEEELRKAEERTRFCLEAANIGTWEWDVLTGQVRWSSNMEAVHGQAPGSFTNSFDTFLEGVFVEDREKVMQQISRAMSGGGSYHSQYRQYRSDGTLGWMEAHGRVEFGPDGKPARMFGVCADITKRKNGESANGLLAAIVASSDDAIVSKTLNGVITSWNHGAEILFGYSAAEAVGQHITLIIPPDRRAEESDILARLSRGERIDHFETVRQRKDGSLVEVSITISPVKDSAGRVVGASKVGRDISARKLTERVLATGVRQQKVLFRLADELHRAVSLEQVYSAALDAILNALQCDRASILLCDEAAIMRFTSWRGLSDEYRAAVNGHSAWRKDDPNPQPVCMADISESSVSDELKATVKKEGISALAFIPLVSNGKLTGKFMAYFDLPHQWTTQEIELSLTIARQLSFAIDRKRNDQALRESQQQLEKEAQNLEREVRARTKELEQKNKHLFKQSEQVRQLSYDLLRVQDDERRRIARELHDSAGQTLTVLGMSLAQLEQAARRETGVSKQLEEIQDLVQQLHREIRTASYLLHPPLLDESGLSSALAWYVQGLTERSGLAISQQISSNIGRLPSDMELAIFRVVQECLTNIHRHSGSKTASVFLSQNKETIQVEVTDQGKGIPPERLAEIQSGGSGVGIRGMQERLHRFGGTVQIQSNGSGTRVVAQVPIPKRKDSKKAQSLEAAV